MKKLLLLSAFLLMLCIGCSSDKTCTIQGTVTVPDPAKDYYAVLICDKNGVDTCLVENGMFTLRTVQDPCVQQQIKFIDAEGNDVGNGDIFDMMEIVADTREMTVDFITQQSSGSPLTTAMNSFIHELYDLLMGDLNPEVDASSYMDSLMRKTYLDHSYDAVGLQAMRLLSHDLEYEEMEELLNQGGSFIREDEGLASLLTYKKARAMEKTEGRVLFVKVGPEGNVLQQEEMDASECHDKRIGQGQYVLLDFWASWCGPCRDEIPNVIRLNNLFAEKGLRILGVTVRDQPDLSKAAISEMKINYDQIFDLEGIISARYSVEGVPHFFLLDPQGNVVLQGHHNLDEFERYLQKNL